LGGYFFGFELVKVIYYCIKICIMDEKQKGKGHEKE
jgi:hypothetical protein